MPAGGANKVPPSGIGGVLFGPKTIHVNLGVSTHRQTTDLFAQLFAGTGIFPC